MSNIAELRATRGVAKASLTRMETFLASVTPDVSMYLLDARLRALPGIQIAFEKAQGVLEVLDPDEISDEAQERASFENRFYEVEAKLRQLIDSSSPNASRSFNPSHNSTVVELSQDLPKIDIPPFHGSYSDYPTFIEMFDTLIHNNTARQLSDIRKFGVLLGVCKGRAYDAIKHLSLTAQNYQVARTILRERFHNERLTFENRITELWDVPKASSSSSLREVHDAMNAHIKALQKLGNAEQIGEGVLIHLGLTKLDHQSVTKWQEIMADKKNIPCLDDWFKFLDKRCTVVESLDATKEKSPFSSKKPTSQPPKFPKAKAYTAKKETTPCPICDGACSEISTCEAFQKLSPKLRFRKIKTLLRCIQCLHPQHTQGEKCLGGKCSECKRDHHTVLHFGKKIPRSHPTGSDEVNQEMTNTEESRLGSNSNPKSTPTQSALTSAVVATNKPDSTQYTPNWYDFGGSYVFLATAIIYVKDAHGTRVPLCALFDGNSQAPFIRADTAKALGLTTVPTNVNVSGVYGESRTLKKAVKIEYSDISKTQCNTFYAAVNPFFNDSHPTQKINIDGWNLPRNVKLADPHFNIPKKVDILMNAQQAYELLCVGQIKIGPGKPLLQKTLLGWVVAGDTELKTPVETPQAINQLSVINPTSLDWLVEKFWTVESLPVPEVKPMSTTERLCETHFRTHTTRKPDGRFVVRLPFSRDPRVLGKSEMVAAKRFSYIQEKLKTDEGLKTQYEEFMDEYIKMGHCKLAVSGDDLNSYTIPHFHVLNPGSTTTKLRVVFDASATTTSGLSLNDILMVGPTIQRDVFTHLLTLRCNKFVITGDVSKMYRQIEVHEADQKYQQIYWTDDIGRMRQYQLTTVTYGTACAPYLATRVLQQLADEEKELVVGAKAIRENMYVDDLMATASTINETIQIYEEVKAVLGKGQLPIRKFCSNSPEVMAAIPPDEHGTSLRFGDKEMIKALGMLWEPTSDTFSFFHESQDKPVTKKGVTSEVASIFDPLGLVSPITVLGKMFIQRLWAKKLHWDESLPQADATAWLKLRTQLQQINSIVIPRFVLCHDDVTEISLHCFSDASKDAYAAAVYVRTQSRDSSVTTRLLCSKTRVAPLKIVSLPRLELLGTLLSAELFEKIINLLPFKVNATYFWSDATIALTWIKSSPHKWTQYVATRVTRIQDITKGHEWRHVPTEANPADIPSRGMLPTQLADSSLWFEGPEFLTLDKSKWPNRPIELKELPEQAPVRNVLTNVIQQLDLVQASKYHSWERVQKVFGYVHKFIEGLKSKKSGPESTTTVPLWVVGNQVPPLTSSELDNGLKAAIKIVQQSQFTNIIKGLKNETKTTKNDLVSRLNLFIDKEGLIRVGGRCENALDLTYDAKNPLLLPADHPITHSLFLHTHVQFMHTGQTQMLGAIYRRFWPLKGRVLANQVVNNCLRCRWVKPKPGEQLMGQLPKYRVTPVTRPFMYTGVDYFEPVWISQPGRGSRRVKAYIAVFICLTTKAVHMEIVDDLTTAGFINALQRFISRRGAPIAIYSDNGTNLIGARNLLMSWHERFNNEKHWQAMYEWCKTNHRIEWKTIPARSPHHGGLWERAVASAKHHLVRTIGEAGLFRAEMETVVTMIEAILNSRPLIPVTLNPKDDCPLTPAHFLIGEPLKTLPEPHLIEENMSYLERFKRLIALKQHFWRRWSNEYLHTLLTRHKWTQQQPNLQIGTYVLLVEKNSKPLTWQWGRVIEVISGADGLVRIVKVKTKSGTYERGITQVCPLPLTDQKPMDNIDLNSLMANHAMGPGCSRK